MGFLFRWKTRTASHGAVRLPREQPACRRKSTRQVLLQQLYCGPTTRRIEAISKKCRGPRPCTEHCNLFSSEAPVMFYVAWRAEWVLILQAVANIARQRHARPHHEELQRRNLTLSRATTAPHGSARLGRARWSSIAGHYIVRRISAGLRS
jgi:hypothetical protein